MDTVSLQIYCVVGGLVFVFSEELNLVTMHLKL